jgi:hypothetical protein
MKKKMVEMLRERRQSSLVESSSTSWTLLPTIEVGVETEEVSRVTRLKLEEVSSLLNTDSTVTRPLYYLESLLVSCSVVENVVYGSGGWLVTT